VFRAPFRARTESCSDFVVPAAFAYAWQVNPGIAVSKPRSAGMAIVTFSKENLVIGSQD